MFIAALFLITRIWKQHRCPSTDEWINKKPHGSFVQWSITQLFKNEIKKILGKLMELEKRIILSEVNPGRQILYFCLYVNMTL